MTLTAIRQLKIGKQRYDPGQSFDVPERVGQTLIDRGLASPTIDTARWWGIQHTAEGTIHTEGVGNAETRQWFEPNEPKQSAEQAPPERKRGRPRKFLTT